MYSHLAQMNFLTLNYYLTIRYESCSVGLGWCSRRMMWPDLLSRDSTCAGKGCVFSLKIHVLTHLQLPPRREKIVPRVERAIRLALLRTGGVPREFTSHTIQNGVLTLFAAGEFEVRNYCVD